MTRFHGAFYILDRLAAGLIATERPGYVNSLGTETRKIVLHDPAVVEPGLSHRAAHPDNTAGRVAPSQLLLCFTHTHRLMAATPSALDATMQLRVPRVLSSSRQHALKADPKVRGSLSCAVNESARKGDRPIPWTQLAGTLTLW